MHSKVYCVINVFLYPSSLGICFWFSLSILIDAFPWVFCVIAIMYIMYINHTINTSLPPHLRLRGYIHNEIYGTVICAISVIYIFLLIPVYIFCVLAVYFSLYLLRHSLDNSLHFCVYGDLFSSYQHEAYSCTAV